MINEVFYASLPLAELRALSAEVDRRRFDAATGQYSQNGAGPQVCVDAGLSAVARDGRGTLFVDAAGRGAYVHNSGHIDSRTHTDVIGNIVPRGFMDESTYELLQNVDILVQQWTKRGVVKQTWRRPDGTEYKLEA